MQSSLLTYEQKCNLYKTLSILNTSAGTVLSPSFTLSLHLSLLTFLSLSPSPSLFTSHSLLSSPSLSLNLSSPLTPYSPLPLYLAISLLLSLLTFLSLSLFISHTLSLLLITFPGQLIVADVQNVHKQEEAAALEQSMQTFEGHSAVISPSSKLNWKPTKSFRQRQMSSSKHSCRKSKAYLWSQTMPTAMCV